MVFKRYILGLAVLLSLAVFTGCGNVETEDEAVTEKKSIKKVEQNYILENSVASISNEQRRQAERVLLELKKEQMIADYMDSYKGAVALRENISSVEIYRAIKKHCATYKIDPVIVVGLVIKESNISQKPRDSSANCRGMCQISKYALDDFNTNVMWPKYHDAKMYYTWEDMYDYDKNIEVACYYLRWLKNSFKDVESLEDILICYNVGHGNLNAYKNKESYCYHTFIINRAQECLNLTHNFAI